MNGATWFLFWVVVAVVAACVLSGTALLYRWDVREARRLRPMQKPRLVEMASVGEDLEPVTGFRRSWRWMVVGAIVGCVLGAIMAMVPS